jgi:K+/H+ antiporter YhaU regulatory subunit KhtT
MIKPSGIREKDGIAKYEKIAVDIAYCICHGEWIEGTLVKGRSTLSGKYSVSPETIRRAVKLLEDANVVEVLDKKGLLVKSVAAAQAFINEHQSEDRIMTLRDDVKGLFAQKKAIDQQLEATLDDLIEQAMSLRNVGLIFPLEVTIHQKSPLVGKSIGELQFWSHTGATIIGVKRGGHLQLSPGPKMVFFEGDVILYVANEQLQSAKINAYVNPEVEE